MKSITFDSGLLDITRIITNFSLNRMGIWSRTYWLSRRRTPFAAWNMTCRLLRRNFRPKIFMNFPSHSRYLSAALRVRRGIANFDRPKIKRKKRRTEMSDYLRSIMPRGYPIISFRLQSVDPLTQFPPDFHLDNCRFFLSLYRWVIDFFFELANIQVGSYSFRHLLFVFHLALIFFLCTRLFFFLLSRRVERDEGCISRLSLYRELPIYVHLYLIYRSVMFGRVDMQELWYRYEQRIHRIW